MTLKTRAPFGNNVPPPTIFMGDPSSNSERVG